MLLSLESPGFCIFVFGIFFKRGFTPTSRTFSALINGLVSADWVPDAVNMFRKLIMFSSVINGLCKIGKTSNAIGLLKLMDNSNSLSVNRIP